MNKIIIFFGILILLSSCAKQNSYKISESCKVSSIIVKDIAGYCKIQTTATYKGNTEIFESIRIPMNTEPSEMKKMVGEMEYNACGQMELKYGIEEKYSIEEYNKKIK